MQERMIANAVDTTALRSKEITVKTHKDNDQLRHYVANNKKSMHDSEKQNDFKKITAEKMQYDRQREADHKLKREQQR